MVKDAIAEIPVMTFLAYRFTWAALLVAGVFHRDLRRLSARGWRAGLLMGGFLTAGYVLQTFGLDLTTPASAGFITGMFVVLTPVFGALLLGQRAGRLAWAAAVVSAAGLYLMTGTGAVVHVAGDLLVFACACAFALHILATDRAATGHGIGALLAVQLGVCGTVSLIVAAGQGALEVPRGWTVWSALVVTAVFASALGFFVQTYAQRHAPPARTALILAGEPAFAGLFAWLLTGQTLSATGWVGAALIMLAIVAVETVPYLRPERPLPER
jgi:drug/metabolite transporter (DMT)-like permease